MTLLQNDCQLFLCYTLQLFYWIVYCLIEKRKGWILVRLAKKIINYTEFTKIFIYSIIIVDDNLLLLSDLRKSRTSKEIISKIMNLAELFQRYRYRRSEPA